MESDEIKTNVEYTKGDEQEEDILLTAQRYLNVFHQIHIFSDKKKKEFDNSLLDLPVKLKKVFVQIPGGRVLLEHVLEVEEAANRDTKTTKSLISQKDPNREFETEERLPTKESSDIKLSNDFAKTLASSFAVALRENNVLPIGGGYRTMAAPNNGGVAAMSQTKTHDNQVNTQNNAAATTINNINLDYSLVNSLSEVIKDSNKQYHDDFMYAIERLGEKISPTTVKPGEIPISLITDSISRALKDAGRQQLEAMKTFGTSLANTILKAQKSNNFDTNNISDTEPVDILSISDEPTKSGNVIGNSETKKDRSSSEKQSSEQKKVSGQDKKPATNKFNSKNDSASKKQQTVSLSDLILHSPINEKPISLVPKLELKPEQKTEPELKPITPEPQLKPIPPQPAPVQAYAEEYNDKDNSPESEEEWEYVDEYGNPVSGDAEEWEYVDENGNPISGDDEEWEYVDENGNPISGDAEEWEYVDENGNPINGDAEEWEYVDEEITDDFEDNNEKEPLSFNTKTIKPENPSKLVSLDTKSDALATNEKISIKTDSSKEETLKPLSFKAENAKPQSEEKISLDTKSIDSEQKKPISLSSEKVKPIEKDESAKVGTAFENSSDNLIKMFSQKDDTALNNNTSKKSEDKIDSKLEELFVENKTDKKTSNIENDNLTVLFENNSKIQEKKEEKDEALDKLIKEFTGS